MVLDVVILIVYTFINPEEETETTLATTTEIQSGEVWL